MIEIEIPGSKSISNRALILSTLAGKAITLKNFGHCSDTRIMMENLEKMGVEFEVAGNTVKVDPRNFNHEKTALKLFTADAGTSTRFLTALSTLLKRDIEIDGSQRMRERPISPLTDALKQIGAEIECKTGCPPLKISASKPKGGKMHIPGDISSQYISAIMLIAPFLEQDTEVEISTELHSKPYLEITEKLMELFGAKVKWTNSQNFQISANMPILHPSEISIEPDASSASYIGAYIAAHPGKKVRLKNLNSKSIQGDIKFLEYLKQMGCEITEKGQDTIIKSPTKLKALAPTDMNTTPDIVMTFAVLALLTEEETHIYNVPNLRIKETDRLDALKNELKKFSVKVETGNDYIKISGKAKKPNEEIKTYKDHRMAMSFGIIQDLFDLQIENPDCVEKSYSTFWQDLKKLQNAA